jgi:CheY-like chemotaxis protein
MSHPEQEMAEQNQQDGSLGTPSGAFIEQVKDALEHLYDPGYLQLHPLVKALGLTTRTSAEFPGQQLRRELISAIEALNPGAGVPFHAPHARLYNILILRYVERRTTQVVAQELGVSLRQAFRNLRDGVESVASILWTRRSATIQREPDTEQLSSFRAEMNLLESRSRSIDMRLLLQRAQGMVEPLAEQRDVRLRIQVPPDPVMVSTDPTVAQQVLTSILSYAIQEAAPGNLSLTLTRAEEQVSLALRYLSEHETAKSPVVSARTVQLVDRLGWTIRQENQSEDTRVVNLQVTKWREAPTVLVIDDNEGLVRLMKRYLSDQGCRVVAAANGQEGLDLAQEVAPDAAVLDVMMPGMPGWEVLQRLHNDPQTSSIPVIICSVINDPDLAYSLGASVFLPKPVRREKVLNALRQLDIV